MAFAPKRRPTKLTEDDNQIIGVGNVPERSKTPSAPRSSTSAKRGHRRRSDRSRTRESSALSQRTEKDFICTPCCSETEEVTSDRSPNAQPWVGKSSSAALDSAVPLPFSALRHPYAKLLQSQNSSDDNEEKEPAMDGICTTCHALLCEVANHCGQHASLGTWASLCGPEAIVEEDPPKFGLQTDPTEAQVPLPSAEEQNAKEDWLLAERRRSDKDQEAEASRIQRSHSPGISGTSSDSTTEHGALYRTILLQRDRQLSKLRSELATNAGKLRETKRILQMLRDSLALHISGYRDVRERQKDEEEIFGRAVTDAKVVWEAWTTGLVSGEEDRKHIISSLKNLEAANFRRQHVRERTAGKLAHLIQNRVDKERLALVLEKDVEKAQRGHDSVSSTLCSKLGLLLAELRSLEIQDRNLRDQTAELEIASRSITLDFHSVTNDTSNTVEELSNTESTCSGLNLQVAQLLEKNGVKRKTTEQLRVELSALTSTFELECKQSSEQATQLRSAKTSTEAQLIRLSAESKQAQTDLATLQAECESLQKTIEKLGYSRASADNRVQEAQLGRDKDLVHHQDLRFTLMEATSSAQAQAEACLPAATALRNQQKSLKGNVEGLEREVKSLQSDLQSIKGTVTETNNNTRKQLDSLVDSKKKVLEDIDATWKRKEVEAEKGSIAASEALRLKRAEITSLREAEEANVEHLRHQDIHVKELSHSARCRVEDAVSETDAMTASCNLVKETTAKLSKDVADLELELEADQRSLQKVATEIADVEKKDRDCVRQTDETALTTTRAREALVVFLSTSAETGRQLESQLEEKEKQLEVALAENESRASDLKDQQHALDAKVDSLQGLKQETSGVKETIARSLETRRNYQLELQQVTSNAAFLRDRYLAIIDKILALREIQRSQSNASPGILFEETTKSVQSALDYATASLQTVLEAETLS